MASTAQFPLRLPVEELDALKGWAAARGRTLTDELRFAVRLYLRELAPTHLDTPEGEENVKEQGLDIAEERRWLKESLKDVRKEAFKPYANPNHRSGVS
jgi:hypothetical protein